MRKIESSYKTIRSLSVNSFSCPKLGILKFSIVDLRLLWFGGLLLLLSLMVFHIFQSNWIVREGYSVESFGEKLAELEKENKKLEINFAQNNSLGTIEERIESLNLVEVNKINYIQLLGGQVAAK